MQSGGTGGSRWGLRGTEDLGNGWSALFDLENGFNIANGRNTATNLMFNRNAYLALRHRDYGTLGFGRQYSPAHGAIADNSPNGFIAQYEPSPYISPGRADNMVRYTGRFKNGLSVAAYYAFSEQNQQMTNNEEVTGHFGGLLGYNYQNRVRVMLAYDRINVGNYPSSGGLPADNAGKGDNWLFGGRVDLGKLAIMGGYRHRKWDMLGQSDIKSELFMIGVNYTYRANSSLSIGYYYDTLKNGPTSMTDNGQRRGDRWHQVAGLATYGLSNRTNLYLTAAWAKNGALNLGIGGDGGYYRLAPNKTSQVGAAVGIRHVF